AAPGYVLRGLCAEGPNRERIQCSAHASRQPPPGHLLQQQGLPRAWSTSIATGHTDVAVQAPQAARQAAPPAAKAAAAGTWVLRCLLRASGHPGRCLSTPDRSAAVAVRRLPDVRRPWCDSGGPERFAAQLGAFFVVLLVVS